MGANRLKLSIIIPTLNRVKELENCLRSIRATTDVVYEVIVYANECRDETLTLLQNFPEVQVIADSQNKFFTEAVNIAISKASGEYVFLLNDDTILLRTDWFEFYQSKLDLNPRIGAVGPYWKNISELPFGWIEPYASMYRRSIFEECGFLPFVDDSFVLWWSDIYHSYKLMKQGRYLYPLKRAVVDCYVQHLRVGESGDTVLAFKEKLSPECFNFHGKQLMYQRLGIGSDSELAGYYSEASSVAVNEI